MKALQSARSTPRCIGRANIVIWYSSVDCQPTATIANTARKYSVELVDYTEHFSANYDELEYALPKFGLVELVYR